jgi:hypothetical protein
VVVAGGFTPVAIGRAETRGGRFADQRRLIPGAGCRQLCRAKQPSTPVGMVAEWNFSAASDKLRRMR